MAENVTKSNVMENKILQAALDYSSKGLHVIPVGKDKIPLVEWKNFQTIPATKEQIETWWMQFPQANVGVITGSVTGLTMIDVDNKNELKYVKSLVTEDTPRFTTGRGGQYVFAWNGENNTVKVAGKEIDVRGDGGYSVFPPSIHSNGAEYKWIVQYNADCLTPVPEELKAAIKKNGSTSGQITPMTYSKGSRDSDLFHAAVGLRRGGMDKEEAYAAIIAQGRGCTPPALESVCRKKVDQAYKSLLGQHASATAMDLVEKEFRDSPETDWSIGDIFGNLKEEGVSRNTIKQCMARLKEHGIITGQGKKYHLLQTLDILRFGDLNSVPYDLKLPWRIHETGEICEGDMLAVCGEKNAGKSGYLAQAVVLNLRAGKAVRYILTENTKKADTRLRAYGLKNEECDKLEIVDARGRNYENVIDPNAVNILDYFNVPDGEYGKSSPAIENLCKQLKNGVLIMGIQQKTGERFPRGGELALELSQLTVTLIIGTPAAPLRRGGDQVKRSICKLSNIKTPANGRNDEGKHCWVTVNNKGGALESDGYFFYGNPLTREREIKAGMPQPDGDVFTREE